MERSNQPPKPEGCSVEGQEPGLTPADRTTSEKRTSGKARAASGTRLPLKRLSLERSNASGDGVNPPEPKTEATVRVRTPRTCRGQRAWHASKRAHGTEEALGIPAARTTRAKQVRSRNEKECGLRVFRESDRLIVASGKA